MNNIMSRNVCNCHWSRYVSNMRHCWNKIFFVIIRVMVVINQAIIMSPFIYYKNSKTTTTTTTLPKASSSSLRKNDVHTVVAATWKFRTHRWVTIMAIFLCIFYMVAAPLMVKLASDLYSSTRPTQDNLFIFVAKFTMACDVICSLSITATHIWYREKIVQILNLFNNVIVKFQQLEKNFVDFKILLALVFKISLTLYETLLSLPFLIKIAPRLPAQNVVAFFFTHYLQGLSYVFALNIFTGILLLLTCSLKLEKELECCHIVYNDLKISQLINLQNSLQKLIRLFINTFQFGIFFIILLYFVTILCNIYAMLDYYVTTHYLFVTFITYLLSVALELYSLILVAYLCDRSQRKVKDLFLQREELHFLQPASIVESDLLWPQLKKFELIGLYTLDNKFALFLLAYSINFIVIILEFEVNKARS